MTALHPFPFPTAEDIDALAEYHLHTLAARVKSFARRNGITLVQALELYESELDQITVPERVRFFEIVNDPGHHRRGEVSFAARGDHRWAVFCDLTQVALIDAVQGPGRLPATYGLWTGPDFTLLTFEGSLDDVTAEAFTIWCA